MQDLEIRGAGELLGARQHGHIMAVGFDLYTRLLAQAIQEARDRTLDPKQTPAGPEADDRQLLESARADGDERPGLVDPLAPTVTLDLNIRAVIPDGYVPEAGLRLQLYRRLAGLATMQAIDEIGQEFSDRFGPLPDEVENLLYVVRVKVLAIDAGVDSIAQEEGQLLIKAGVLDGLDRDRLQEQVSALGIPARVVRRAIWLPMRDAGAWRRDLMKTLETVRDAARST